MTGPVTCQLWTGEELTGLYPSLLSDCQLVDSEGGDLVVFGGIPECSKPKVTQTAWLNSRESQNKTRNMPDSRVGYIDVIQVLSYSFLK